MRVRKRLLGFARSIPDTSSRAVGTLKSVLSEDIKSLFIPKRKSTPEYRAARSTTVYFVRALINMSAIPTAPSSARSSSFIESRISLSISVHHSKRDYQLDIIIVFDLACLVFLITHLIKCNNGRQVVSPASISNVASNPIAQWFKVDCSYPVIKCPLQLTASTFISITGSQFTL